MEGGGGCRIYKTLKSGRSGDVHTKTAKLLLWGRGMGVQNLQNFKSGQNGDVHTKTS